MGQQAISQKDPVELEEAIIPRLTHFFCILMTVLPHTYLSSFHPPIPNFDKKGARDRLLRPRPREIDLTIR
jgi:hypothetical protein